MADLGRGLAAAPEVSPRDAVDLTWTAEEVAREIGEARPSVSPGPLWYGWAAATLGLGAVGFKAAAANDVGWPYAVAAASIALVTSVRLRSTAQAADAARTALRLAHLGPGSVGSLIECLQSPFARVRAVAACRLTTLLPMLSEANGRELTAVHRACLNDALNRGMASACPDLVSAILQAFHKFGDTGSAHAVARFAGLRCWTRRQRALRGEALAALPQIEANVYARRLQCRAEARAGETPAADRALEAGAAALSPLAEITTGRPLMRFGFLIAVYAIVLPYGIVEAFRMVADGVWPLALPFLGLAAVASQMHRLTLMSRHARLVRDILREKDKASVGRIAEAATWPDTRIRTAALSALTRLMPSLRATDSGLLTSSQRACLYATLNRSTALSHPEYVVAVLAGLEHVGDVMAVPYVKDLAAVESTSSKLLAVRDAARACLPALLDRAQRNTDQQMLVRPAMAPADPGQILVRPASASASVNTAMLVRVPDMPEPDAAAHRQAQEA